MSAKHTQESKRRRNAAGYEHVSGWADNDTAREIGPKLMTGDEVDAEIERKGKDG